ncbi:hypothetical protein [Macrococcoides caseolyticum]|nr:hypothetical protein [Macrococcus caseolyticus]
MGTRCLSLYVANNNKIRHLGIENKIFIAVCGEQRQSPPPS